MSKYKILKEYEQSLIKVSDILKTVGTTNNFQLEKLGKMLFGDLFLGVFTADQFPKYIKKEQMFIINTDPKSKPGVHWVSFIKSKNGKLYGYDSFNRDLHSLSPYFKHKQFINANSDVDEVYVAKNCGQLSLTWLICAHKYGPDKVMNII